MLVPIVVPFVPKTTVVNKNIIYSDTILPLKDIGINLKTTSISDVEESSLEDCLKTIFESNPNVVFNTIQYSKSINTVYFYTDTEISKKSWEDKKVKTYKPLTSSSKILEELKRILTTDKNKDTDCVSVYDIAVLMKEVNNYYKEFINRYRNIFDCIIKSKFGGLAEIIIYDFDYDNNELSIGFKTFGSKYNKITFSKMNGDLYISKSECLMDKDVFAALCKELSTYYDEIKKLSYLKKEKSYKIEAVNSNFLVNISSYEVMIFDKSYSRMFTNNFELTSYSYRDEYGYNCNSSNVLSEFQGKEDEILKKVFVKISDCPKWSQNILYEIRQNGLAEEQKIEDEKKIL